MKRIVRVTLVGAAAGVEDKGLEVRKLSYNFADLMSLGTLDRSALVIVDAHEGFVQMPSDSELLASLSASEADPILRSQVRFFAEETIGAAGGAGKRPAFNLCSGGWLASDCGLGRATVSLSNLLSRKEDADLTERCRRYLAAGVALRSAMEHILDSTRAGALAVVVVPAILGNGKRRDMDNLYASVLPGFKVTGRPGAGALNTGTGLVETSPLLSDFLAGVDVLCRKAGGYVGYSPNPETDSQGLFLQHECERFLDNPFNALALDAAAGFRHGKALIVPHGRGSVVLVPEGVDVPGIAAFALSCVAKAASENGRVIAGASVAKAPKPGILEAMLPGTREGIRSWDQAMGWGGSDRRRGAIDGVLSLARTLDSLSGKLIEESRTVDVVGGDSAGFTKRITGGAMRALIKTKLKRTAVPRGLRDFLLDAHRAWKQCFLYE